MRKCNTGLQFCQENSLWINDTLFNSSFQITYCQQPKDVQLSIFLSELLKTQKGLIPQHIPIIGRSFPVQVKGRYKQDGRDDLAPMIPESRIVRFIEFDVLVSVLRDDNIS